MSCRRQPPAENGCWLRGAREEADGDGSNEQQAGRRLRHQNIPDPARRIAGDLSNVAKAVEGERPDQLHR